MTISDRIHGLRKTKGISQEELADMIGVSRQAVSKWESEQSIPDIEKIIALSDLFDVTTDYLLKGIENKKLANVRSVNASIFVVVATVMSFIGLILSSVSWYQNKKPMAVVIGLIFMALGCMVFGVGLYNNLADSKKAAKKNFWMINIWILAFLPLSLVYNVLFTGKPAPYPLYSNDVALVVFWIVYIILCSAVTLSQVKLHGKKHA